MAAPVILVEAQPRRAADGVPVTVRLAGGGAEHPYTYFGQHWRAGIDGLPGTIASLEFDGEQLGGGGVAQAMTVRWAPAGGAALAELAALYWGDAAVTVRIGPEGAPPPVVTAGLVLDVASEGGALKIALADQAPALKRPLLVDRFAGTGDLEGPAEWKGLIRTRAWGRCFNVPGKCIDPANHIWSFGDPARPWQAFHQVRDRGATAAALTLVGWEGSIAATLAALRAAAAPEGGGVACPSLACVRWWKEPSGDLHADVSGEIAGGYVETAPEIAARIVAAAAGVAIGFVPGAVAAAAAARPDPFGWRVTAESATAAGELSALLGDVSLSWIVAGDAIDFRRWDWSAPVRAARSEGVVRRQVFKPVKARRLGYRRNQAPMARGDIAAAVLAGLNAPLILTQWSANGAGGWHANYVAGQDFYYRQSNDDGLSWGPAIRGVAVDGEDGTDGIDGTDGKLVQFVWRRSATQPAAPAGAGVPAGWSDDPIAGASPLWMSKVKQELDGSLVAGAGWSTPIRHDGPPGTNGQDGTDGTDGTNGVDGVTISASPLGFNIPALPNGTSKPVWAGGQTRIALIKGGAEVAADAYSYHSAANMAGMAIAGQIVSFSDIVGDLGTFVVRATRGGVSYDLEISVTKARDGSPAFSASASFNGAGAGDFIASATVPGGSRKVTMSATAGYDAPYHSSQSRYGKGAVTLYWRNATDDGPWQLLGSEIGSQAASEVSYPNGPTEPEYSFTPGSVAASFDFTGPAAAKQIEYRVLFSTQSGVVAAFAGTYSVGVS